MSFVRRAIPFFLALVFVAPGHAATKANPKPVPPNAPQGLHAFLLRADEAVTDSFERTPSFAWTPVAGVTKYEFELSTSSRFAESAQVWAGEIAGTPAVAVPVALPWMTGKPYSFYARVRTVSTTGRSSWSSAFGFNMRAPDAPKEPAPSYPGLVRWPTVEGATSYQVWWTDPYLNKRISALTNSADEREYYTFHQWAPWPSIVNWRVRAVRSVYGGLPNGLPAVSYGPWSRIFTSYNPPFSVGGQVTLSSSVSATVNATSDRSDPTDAHTQTPAFLFTGTQSLAFLESELYRVYVYTDKDCVNQVFRGAIVGSPAYSPRTSGPLALPHPPPLPASQLYVRDGSEGLTAMADQTKVVSSEEKTASSSSPSGSAQEPPTPTPPSEQPAASTSFTLPKADGALVDLWDSGWPTGRYYWTVVPVYAVNDYIKDEEGKETKAWIYRDAELPQEACAAGRIGSFGKESDPALISPEATSQYPASAPYVSGLSTDGHLVSATKAKPVFYGTPLVAWSPARGAAAYEVQWSRSLYPWSSEGTVFTFGTSTLLQASGGKTLAPGNWYYRVRGLDPYLPSEAKVMSWSTPVQVVVAKPMFAVIKGAPEEKKKKNAKLGFRTLIQPGFAVALPSSWKVKANPFAKFYLAKGGLRNLSTGKTSLRFMAHDPADRSLTTGLSISYIATPWTHTHASWVKAVKETVAKQSRLVGKPFCVESTLPAGSTLKCAYSFRVANSKLVESEVSYWFDRLGKTYVLALDNLRSANKANAPLRLSIAKKFKITS